MYPSSFPLGTQPETCPSGSPLNWGVLQEPQAKSTHFILFLPFPAKERTYCTCAPPACPLSTCILKDSHLPFVYVSRGPLRKQTSEPVKTHLILSNILLYSLWQLLTSSLLSGRVSSLCPAKYTTSTSHSPVVVFLQTLIFHSIILLKLPTVVWVCSLSLL